MTRRAFQFAALLAGVFGGLTAGADTVYTTDGRVLHGEIVLGENGALKVMTPNKMENVPAAMLKRALFDTPNLKPGLSRVKFKIYQGDWKTLPKLSQLPIDKSGRMAASQLDLTPLDQEDARRIFAFSQGQSLRRWSAPAVEGRPFTVEATVEALSDNGVILAHGGNQGGYAIYLKDGHLVFATRIQDKLTGQYVFTPIRDENPFPLNKKVKVTAALKRDLGMSLAIDGREVAMGQSPDFIPSRPLEGISIGFDQRPGPVGPYRLQNYFQGSIENLQLRVMGMAIEYAGNLNVAKTGTYQFKLEADAATRLVVNGRTLIDNTDPAKPRQVTGSIDLTTGLHEFALIYAQLQSAKPQPDPHPRQTKLAFEWTGPGFTSQPLAGEAHPQATTWRPSDLAIPSAGVMTLDGSFFAQPVERIDQDKIHFEVGSLARKDLSAIFLRPLSILDAKKLHKKPGGALLMDGGFTEGKLMSVKNGVVTVSSILFGLKSYSYGGEAVAIVFKPASGDAPRRLLMLRDGSRLYAEKFFVKDKSLVLPDVPFNGYTVPLTEIVEIHNAEQPHLLEIAGAHWERHSPAGQHFLGARNRRALEVIKEFREWKFRLKNAQRDLLAARRDLPKLIKAEAEMKAIHEKAMANREAPQKLALEETKKHTAVRIAWQAAEKKLHGDCEKSAAASVKLQNAIHDRQVPALKAVTRTKVAVVRATFGGDKQKLTAARAQHAAAVKALTAANAQVQTCQTEYAKAVQVCAVSAEEEAKLHHTESAAWVVADAAQRAAKQAEQDFRESLQDWNNAKNELAGMQARQARGRREYDLSKGNMEGLKPALAEIIVP